MPLTNSSYFVRGRIAYKAVSTELQLNTCICSVVSKIGVEPDVGI